MSILRHKIRIIFQNIDFKAKKFEKLVLIIWGGILISSCSLPGLLSTSNFDSEAVAAQKATIVMRMTMSALPGNEITPSPMQLTSTPTVEMACAFVWAVKQDEALSQLFQAELPESMRSQFELGVSWYGENCVDVETNTVKQFNAMDLEFTVFYAVHEKQTEDWMGEQIVAVMQVILPLWEQQPELDGYPVMIHFVFNQDGEMEYINFSVSQYQEMQAERGLRGAALLQALRG